MCLLQEPVQHAVWLQLDTEFCFCLVAGSGTGAVLFSPFVRLNDSSWVTALPLQHAETLTVTLTVAGEQLPSQQINVTNPTPAGSPADIGLLAQLQAPMLQIGTNQQSSQNISQSAELQVYVGEDACIYISAQTPAGDRCVCHAPLPATASCHGL